MIEYLCWSKGTPNWGDDCNPFLFKMIAGFEPKHVNIGQNKNMLHYMMVGSIIHYGNTNTHIWGTGARFDVRIKKPARVYAVRGPLTRNILIKNNIDCPEVYGDPVLLLPRFYKPKIEKKYKLGIIPHYIDKHIVKVEDKNVKLIDVQSGFERVINDILECENIVSSSLHGLILADAYEVPAMWLRVSDKVEGSELKFNDYFLSVGRPTNVYINYWELKETLDALKQFYRYKIDIDLDKLYETCPFRRKDDKTRSNV